MSKRTRLLGKSGRKLTPTMILRKYKAGQLVTITQQSRYEGMPHPRYRGRIGTVKEVRGTAYVVEIRDGNMIKKIIVPGVHLTQKDKMEGYAKASPKAKKEAKE